MRRLGSRRRRDSLLGQIVAVNVLLVTATLFAASVAATLDLGIGEERRQFAILTMSILLTLLLNMLMLRRRFSPLERLIAEVEAIDPTKPSRLERPGQHQAEEIERLAASFSLLLERIEEERWRGARRVLAAQEVERKRLARDLHDQVNQSLTAILLRLEALGQDASAAPIAAELAETKRLANGAMEELLRLARQLRPTALDDHGLMAAIEGQVHRFREHTGIEARLDAQGELSALGDERELVLYRVVQEALNNAARHSGAGRVEVGLRATNGGVLVSVRDDGRGFEASSAERGGLGLGGMAERARLVGGELSIVSAPGAGTAVELSVP